MEKWILSNSLIFIVYYNALLKKYYEYRCYIGRIEL